MAIYMDTQMEDLPASCEECDFHPSKDGIGSPMAFNALCYMAYKNCPLRTEKQVYDTYMRREPIDTGDIYNDKGDN